jgi:hypothetical protein
MSTRDPREFRAFVERWYELWNDNDKQGWLEHWRSVAPGEPQIEDPVGKPVKRGWGMVEELWDRTGEDHFKVVIQEIFVCGDEAAAVCHAEGTFRGTTFQIPSVDVHQFHGESLAIRSYWEIPPGIPYGVWTANAGEPVVRGSAGPPP